MADAQQDVGAMPRCVLCPGGCELGLAARGPDTWRIEYPATAGAGVCPRGSALGELLGHPRRILYPARREGDRLASVDMPSALHAILDRAAGGKMLILLDGNIPLEQLEAAADAVDAWPAAQLCLVVEGADEQLLLGIEAGGAQYVGDAELQNCDGFLVIGDAFSANPRCSRGVLDRHKAEPRTPIVVIDPGGGKAAKFATHRLDVPAGGEAAALSALASGAGVANTPPEASAWRGAAQAAQAGKALAACKRPAVLIAAEYARGGEWRRIGWLASKLAAALGGAIAPQTTGANALAAVRLAAERNTVSLAQAIADDGSVKVALGCDVLGMLGRDDIEIFGAAAALPNKTTAAAKVLLPAAMSGEYGGAYLFQGKLARVAPLLAAPRNIASPGELALALARAAGAADAPPRGGAVAPKRLCGAEVPAEGDPAESPALALVLSRDAGGAGCGELTAHGPWQMAQESATQLRISPADARKMGLSNLAAVKVRANGRSISASVLVAPELPPGVVTLPEAFAAARTLAPSKAESKSSAVVAGPAPVQVSE